MDSGNKDGRRTGSGGAKNVQFAEDLIKDLAGNVEEKLHVSDISAGSSGSQGELKNTTTSSPATCVIVLGMAGSGKTTFVQKLTEHLSANHDGPPYLINLDPAVRHVPYSPNVDIRDTVNYKAVMQRFGLGPNGGIMTALNLFTTKFASVLELLEKRRNLTSYMVFDTPGQIEVFTWSASGTIITETLGDLFPTVVVYVLDVSSSTNPITFMSNMLYACSILYKSKLPFIIAMNKTDLADPRFAVDWMTDFELFDVAIEREESYAANLSRSLALILDEFYNAIKYVPVSSVTGAGFAELVTALEAATQEYQRDYKPELDRLKQEQKEMKERQRLERLEKLKKEVVEISASQGAVSSSRHSLGVFNENDELAEETINRDDDAAEEESFKKFLATVVEAQKNVAASKKS